MLMIVLWWIFLSNLACIFLLFIYFFPFLLLSLSHFNFILCLNKILCALILILHSTFFIPFFIHEVNFTFYLHIAATHNSYLCSFFYPLKIIFLSVGHLIFTLLSYNSLNLFTPLLILVHLLLMVGLRWGELFLQVWVCLLGLVVLFWKYLYNSTKDMVGGVTFSQPARGKDSTEKDTTTINTITFTEPTKIIKFR